MHEDYIPPTPAPPDNPGAGERQHLIERPNRANQCPATPSPCGISKTKIACMVPSFGVSALGAWPSGDCSGSVIWDLAKPSHPVAQATAAVGAGVSGSAGFLFNAVLYARGFWYLCDEGKPLVESIKARSPRTFLYLLAMTTSAIAAVSAALPVAKREGLDTWQGVYNLVLITLINVPLNIFFVNRLVRDIYHLCMRLAERCSADKVYTDLDDVITLLRQLSRDLESKPAAEQLQIIQTVLGDELNKTTNVDQLPTFFQDYMSSHLIEQLSLIASLRQQCRTPIASFSYPGYFLKTGVKLVATGFGVNCAIQSLDFKILGSSIGAQIGARTLQLAGGFPKFAMYFVSLDNWIDRLGRMLHFIGSTERCMAITYSAVLVGVLGFALSSGACYGDLAWNTFYDSLLYALITDAIGNSDSLASALRYGYTGISVLFAGVIVNGAPIIRLEQQVAEAIAHRNPAYASQHAAPAFIEHVADRLATLSPGGEKEQELLPKVRDIARGAREDTPHTNPGRCWAAFSWGATKAWNAAAYVGTEACNAVAAASHHLDGCNWGNLPIR